MAEVPNDQGGGRPGGDEGEEEEKNRMKYNKRRTKRFHIELYKKIKYKSSRIFSTQIETIRIQKKIVTARTQ